MSLAPHSSEWLSGKKAPWDHAQPHPPPAFASPRLTRQLTQLMQRRIFPFACVSVASHPQTTALDYIFQLKITVNTYRGVKKVFRISAFCVSLREEVFLLLGMPPQSVRSLNKPFE